MSLIYTNKDVKFFSAFCAIDLFSFAPICYYLPSTKDFDKPSGPGLHRFLLLA